MLEISQECSMCIAHVSGGLMSRLKTHLTIASVNNPIPNDAKFQVFQSRVVWRWETHTWWSRVFEIEGNYTIVCWPCDCFRLISDNPRKKTNSEISPKLHNYLLARCFALILNSSRKWQNFPSERLNCCSEGIGHRWTKMKIKRENSLSPSNCSEAWKLQKSWNIFKASQWGHWHVGRGD